VIKRMRFSLTLLLALVLSAPFACAPKKIKVYETESAIQARSSLAEYAITLLGKPYRSGAKGPQSFDCSGLVYYVYGRFDVMMPASTEGLGRVGYEVSRNNMTAGDLAVFRIKGDMHVGIMINALEFIHASKSRGVAIDSVDLPYWQQNFSHFRRVF
jgi:cell wall-associated NlpC family hydrolase